MGKEFNITIQKAIKLMDDDVYHQFTNYLQGIKADMSLKLVNAVSRDLSIVNSSDELAQKVYGKVDTKTKQNFNQLASHTFRLTGFISASYPNYLLHNIGRIEKLINSGKTADANRLMQYLYDIAEKIEDFTSLTAVLKIQAQQAILARSYSENLRLHQEVEKVLETERLMNEFFYRIRKHFNAALRDKEVQKLVDENIEWFESHANHTAKTISLFCKVQIIHIYYYYKQTEFFKPETLEMIKKCEDELEANPYLVFPYLFDLPSKLAYLHLNMATSQLDSPTSRNIFKRLTQADRIPKYWNSYVNHPMIYALAIQASHLLSKYQYLIHKPNYVTQIPAVTRENIEYLRRTCIEEQQKPLYKEHVNDSIYLTITLAAISLLCGVDSIKKSTDDLEELMITYQQIPFSESIDTIFICLMIGYFVQGKYAKCSDTFKRYLKLSTYRVSIAVNEKGIYSYYYVSQWLHTGRKQYLKKIKEHLDSIEGSPEMATMHQSLVEMVVDYNIPLSEK